MNLSPVGIWSAGLRFADPAAIADAAAELEELGYGALWIPGGTHPGTTEACGVILDATQRAVVASGIVNIWVEDAPAVAASHAAISAEHSGRLLTGVGISHAVIGQALPGVDYTKPFSAMQAYLDTLEASDTPIPQDELIIAAIGPKMLKVSAERAAGTHPYLMPPEHTAIARGAVGPDTHVAPEITVVLETDPEAARAAGRQFLQTYINLPNYMGKLRELLGFEDADFENGGSNRLVDATVCWGDEDAIVKRVKEHHDAGADHVCLQVVVGGAEWNHLPLEQWRRLATVLVN